jgi:small-conductance mechanosensitive channel
LCESSTFLFDVNVVSLFFALMLIPIIRDALGGLFLMSHSTFEVLDELEIDGKRGRIERIGLFAVVVKDDLDGFMTLVGFVLLCFMRVVIKQNCVNIL